MDEDRDGGGDPVADAPLAAGVAVFTLAAVAWVGVSAVLRDGPDPVSTLLFAGTFTVVYVGFSRYTSVS